MNGILITRKKMAECALTTVLTGVNSAVFEEKFPKKNIRR